MPNDALHDEMEEHCRTVRESCAQLDPAPLNSEGRYPSH